MKHILIIYATSAYYKQTKDIKIKIVFIRESIRFLRQSHKIMQAVDYLIVAENATLGQEVYINQRKDMLEELGYSASIIKFDSPKMRITLDMLRIAYVYKKKLEKYLETVRPQIIEFYCPATLILQDIRLLRNFKIIASFDLPFGINTTHFGSTLLHILERNKFNDADLIVSLTKRGENFLVLKYKISRKIIQLPYVLNPEELENIKVFNGDFVVSYCPKDRLERKGLDILIKAWNEISTEKRLVIIGTDEKNAIRYLLKKGIMFPKNVEFIPFLPRDEFLSLLSSCSFFISSSRFEEFGQIIIESLSLGKPVITTPTIGPSELLNDIDKKLISPTFSPSDLAKTIKYLEENLSDTFIKNGIKHFKEIYNYELVKNRLYEEVKTLLSGGSYSNRK